MKARNAEVQKCSAGNERRANILCHFQEALLGRISHLGIFSKSGHAKWVFAYGDSPTMTIEISINLR